MLLKHFPISIRIHGVNLLPSEPKTASNPNIIPGILSDSDRGNDYLNITKDVTAFARVIAAKSFAPPLAVALFGKWGSGKSFFYEKNFKSKS
jgi:hypothetical protein